MDSVAGVGEQAGWLPVIVVYSGHDIVVYSVHFVPEVSVHDTIGGSVQLVRVHASSSVHQRPGRQVGTAAVACDVERMGVLERE